MRRFRNCLRHEQMVKGITMMRGKDGKGGQVRICNLKPLKSLIRQNAEDF